MRSVAEDCIFCRIVRGDVPAQEVLRTADVLAFRDLTPVAPMHVLVVPTAHVTSLDALEDETLAGRLLLAGAEVARLEHAGQGGYRVVTNVGPDAGQSVQHLHLHVLAGRGMQWPPG